MSSTEQNTTEQIVTKKKKVKVLPFIIIGIIILVVVAVLAVLVVKGVATASNEKRVQEQLDLGERYLQELDYEQAIVAYTTAIEIDPKNVDAYLGLADVYVAMDDYDQAIEVLEKGYDETADDKIKDRIEELIEEIEEASKEEQESAEAESESSEAEEDNSLPREVVPGEVVDGIYHNPYYEYDLSEESLTYLNGIFEEIEAGNGKKVADELSYGMIESIIAETQNNSIQSNALIYNTSTGKIEEEVQSANIVLNDRKIYLKCAVGVNGEERAIIYNLPMNEGKGYIIHNEEVDNMPSKSLYCVGDCINGVFWGDYEGKVTYNNGGLYVNYSCSGKAVNGLMDGELVRVYETYVGLKDVMVFSNGEVSDKTYTINAEGEIVPNMITTYQNGVASYGPFGGATEESIAQFFNGTFSMDVLLDFSSTVGTEVDGGMRYYEW